MVKRTINDAAAEAYEAEAERLAKYDISNLLTTTRYSAWQQNFLQMLNDTPLHNDSDPNIDETQYTMGQINAHALAAKKVAKKKKKSKSLKEIIDLMSLMKIELKIARLDDYITRVEDILANGDLDDHMRAHAITLLDQLREGRNLATPLPRTYQLNEFEQTVQTIEKKSRIGAFVPVFAGSACAFLWSMRGVRARSQDNEEPDDGPDDDETFERRMDLIGMRPIDERSYESPCERSFCRMGSTQSSNESNKTDETENEMAAVGMRRLDVGKFERRSARRDDDTKEYKIGEDFAGEGYVSQHAADLRDQFSPTGDEM